jgi:hypothetical protein
VSPVVRLAHPVSRQPRRKYAYISTKIEQAFRVPVALATGTPNAIHGEITKNREISVSQVSGVVPGKGCLAG